MRRHLAAWALVLAACAGAVASRVLGGDQRPPETFALSRSHPEPHVRTVTLTVCVRVTVVTWRRAAGVTGPRASVSDDESVPAATRPATVPAQAASASAQTAA